MADLKISQLTAITVLTPATDVLPVVDVGGVTKKIQVNQILASNGVAALASATITGDLTVDTSTLRVDSTNNRVGIGTASPAAALDVQGSSLRLQLQSSSNGAYCTWKYIGKNSSGTAVNFEQGLNIAADNAFELYDNQNTQLVSRYISGVSGYHSWFLGGITGLTLNSTGLGVGVSPVYKFHAAVTSGAVGAFRATTAAIARLIVGNTVEDVELKVNANGDGQLTANASKYLGLGSGGLNDRVILDTTGNLLVGTTNTSATAGPGFKSQFSSTVPQFAIVVNEAGTSTSLSIYNVNAAAYRFYVNNGGTVFATNTTISAISDARLKENVQNLDVGLNEILALKPRKFDWKEGKGKDIKGDRGFIAQEFETVFPNLIDEWADPAPEGEAPYKSVRQDLIPVLVKAIQELTARVQTLEAR